MSSRKFFSGGFLYNPKTQSVPLQLRDDKALINPNLWGFFGGLSEGDESAKGCFLRELKEEISVLFSEEDVITLYDYYNPERNVQRNVFYIVSGLETSAMTLGEGAGFEWIPLDKVFEYSLTTRTRDDLKKFAESLPK